MIFLYTLVPFFGIICGIFLFLKFTNNFSLTEFLQTSKDLLKEEPEFRFEIIGIYLVLLYLCHFCSLFS